MSKKSKNVISALMLIAFGVGMALYSNTYKGLSLYENDPGANFLPFIYSVAIAVLSVVYLITALLNKDEEFNRKEEKEKVSSEKRSDMLRTVISVVLLAAYVFTFKSVGFLIGSIVYLFLQQLILEDKKQPHWVRMIFIAVLLPIACQILFVNVLNYMLPSGILGRWI